MRIGVIAPPWVPVPPPAYGGTEAVVDTLVRGLAARGHDVTLFTTGDATCDVPRAHALDTPAEPMGMILPEVFHVTRAYDALAGCDVIHDHTLLGPPLSAGRDTPPVVTTNHAPFGGHVDAIFRLTAGRVPLVAISHAHAALAPPDVPVARVIHHGIDVDRFPVGDGDGDYVLFLGRMAPEKGAADAIAAARTAGVRLVIAAKMREPAEHAYFDEHIRPHLGDDVVYAGEVGGSRKTQLLGNARALVNPITWPEPFGLVMVEALACGTPVLVYPNGSAPEIVEQGVTGLLCSDADELASAIGKAHALDRAACREAAATRFSADRMVQEHVALYEEVSAAARS
jgi:glycosyltransferase involved in cell wall biosynthesis